MTTVDEAREALLQGLPATRLGLDALIATVRADQAAFDAKVFERESAETLRALRCHDFALGVLAGDHQPSGNDPVDSDSWHVGFGAGVAEMQRAVRAALAATPAEDEEGRT